MLISEIRNQIKYYNKKELESIIVELYKRIPKSKKEDYNIDMFIKNVNNDNKVVKKELDFETLQKEILYFLECVDYGYYTVPNKVISKKERSAWRFKVKRYYKELNNILPKSVNGGMATFLLIEIFKRLSIGSNRLLFINWETFNALGISQSDYYDMIIKRILYNNYTEDNLKRIVDLLSIEKDPYELSYTMFWVFISNLKTVGMKEDGIKYLYEKIKELQIKLKDEKDDMKQFDLKWNINKYALCITEIYFILGEVETGINYFHKNYNEESKEVKEYILLDKLDELNLKKYWILEYEKNMDKVDFRVSLKEQYQELKKENKI